MTSPAFLIGLLIINTTFLIREFVKVVLQKADKLIPQTTLSKYILETRIPTKDNMKAITIATDQEVQPNDFYSD